MSSNENGNSIAGRLKLADDNFDDPQDFATYLRFKSFSEARENILSGKCSVFAADQLVKLLGNEAKALFPNIYTVTGKGYGAEYSEPFCLDGTAVGHHVDADARNDADAESEIFVNDNMRTLAQVAAEQALAQPHLGLTSAETADALRLAALIVNPTDLRD